MQTHSEQIYDIRYNGERTQRRMKKLCVLCVVYKKG